MQHLASVIETIAGVPEDEIDAVHKEERLILYRDSNDAFRNLLLGKFGRLPLGFPADWVYESAFGSNYKAMIKERTDQSPLAAASPTNGDLWVVYVNPGDIVKKR